MQLRVADRYYLPQVIHQGRLTLGRPKMDWTLLVVIIVERSIVCRSCTFVLSFGNNLANVVRDSIVIIFIIVVIFVIVVLRQRSFHPIP
jgi:hypothetical protein